jgi:metallo-beta-lactamase family protein
VRAPERSKLLNARRDPCIVISASGMMEAGRVRHHLFHSLAHPENGVLAVGYCAPGTLGAELLGGAREVHIFGETVPVRAAILRMGSFSAHGDRGELLRYLSCQDKAAVRELFLVHGIDKARSAFQQLLQKQGYPQVVLPRLRQPHIL